MQNHDNAPAAPARPTLDPAKWNALRLFAMDVDGVLTDGTVIVGSDGGEAKAFSILDGLGLVRLLRAGFEVAWISGRPSEATARRAQELKIPHLVQGRLDKKEALRELLEQLQIQPDEACYMGDDDIDAPAMKFVRIGIAVPDAMPAALSAAAYVTRRAAGRGAVREVCELLLAARDAGPGS